VEFHGSWEAYFAAKASLFTDVGRDRPAILNGDDPHFARLAALVTGPLTTYGFAEGSDVRAVDVQPTGTGTRFLIERRGERVETHVGLPGRYNVANGLAAAALALEADLTLERVAEGLAAAQPPPGRMQRVDEGQPFTVLIDYAHTANAFQSALSTLREGAQAPNRLIAVFGAAGNRDRAKRPELARIARNLTDFFIVTNEDPCDERPEDIIDQIVAGVPKWEEGARFAREGDRASAIRRAIDMARPGDTVIILGKGHEHSIQTKSCALPWNDALAVHEILSARRSGTAGPTTAERRTDRLETAP
jgi:UDP-N-acetylmuramoyl-L-alanyl-D-glutamate--2,6-diaminopimelate ligase